MTQSPFAPHLAARGHVLLDGGLASQLEAEGHDLDHALWSARLLEEDPDAIRRAHRAFLDAGADCAHRTMMDLTALKLVQTTCREKKYDFQGVKIGAILETRAPDSGCPPWNVDYKELARKQLAYEAEFNKRERERRLAKEAAAQSESVAG